MERILDRKLTCTLRLAEHEQLGHKTFNLCSELVTAPSNDIQFDHLKGKLFLEGRLSLDFG